jgi:Tol biopolymer transport system component
MQLTSGSSDEIQPAVSPDGKTLLYTALTPSSQQQQIVAIDLGTKAVRQVTREAGGAIEGVFSPDGTTIAYVTGPSVYLINADGTSPRPVVVAVDGGIPRMFDHPSFVPGGRAIVVDRGNGIESYDLTGAFLATLESPTTTDELFPTISPSGDALAFLCGCSGNTADTLVRVSGSGSATYPCGDQVLTYAPGGGMNHPSWGPRGMMVVSRPKANQGNVIAVVDSAGTLTELPSGGGRAMNPVWVQTLGI